jgi:hypothetical protein
MMAAWRGYTDHHDYGDEWPGPREERPAPATIPDRGRYDADLAPAFTALAAMYGPRDRRTIAHLERLIASLRRQNDALRTDREGVELALKDSAADLAKQDRELIYLRTMNAHQARTIDDLRQRLAGRDLTGWEL